jgi:23S rRNA pseudouridine2605 synthase
MGLAMEKQDKTGERIAKVLARAGVASRREAERMIAAGLVAVNGKVIDSPALNVTDTDRITVEGKPLAEKQPARLWLYYKPLGLVTTASDEKGRATVFDRLPPELPRVMSVGRLDLNSEGLLLLTNDGELKRRLELPSTGWLRKYRVRVNGRPDEAMLEPLRQGIVADGERFQPMTVTLDRQQGANAWLTVGLREGKNREIRRAMAAVGLTVNRLIRISYGPFRLGELQPGAVEEVRPKVLREQLGLKPEAGAAARPAAAAKRRPGAGPKPGGGRPRPAGGPARTQPRKPRGGA